MIWENSKFGEKVGERIEEIMQMYNAKEGNQYFSIGDIPDFLWEIAEMVNQHHLERKKMGKIKKIAVELDIRASSIATQLDVSEVLVYKWLNGDKPVGAIHCLKLCKILKDKISPYQLRPDVFKRGM